MKIGWIVLAVVLSIAGIWLYADSRPLMQKPAEENVMNSGEVKQPVLVELFTSEGCSSCPPADRQLTFLSEKQPVAGAEVIALAFHVDYWDRLGWKDAFSSAEYSEHQNDYIVAKKLDSSYTPQMIVDGVTEFVGSNAQKANAAISNAVRERKGTVEISVSDKSVDLKIGRLPEHKAATVYVAVAEDGLETKVGAGENGGMTLPHSSVVRKLILAGNIDAGKSEFSGKIELPTGQDWKSENVKYVVFAQENTSKRVIAVGQVKAVAK